jgi:acyl-CoA thioester hydrolase
MSGSAPAFELHHRVEPSEIEEQGHVNNTIYLRWVQEVAIAHWQALAPAAAVAEIGWVVLRHEIDYKLAARAGDELVIRTWLGGSSGLSFERHTEILRGAGRNLLARARTLWCPIDLRSGRPRRVTPELRALVSVPVE